MSTTTFGSALAKVGVTVPAHLMADAEAPVHTGVQAQGDLLVFPIADTKVKLETVPDKGVQVVFGEATGNSHFIHRGFDSPDVKCGRVDDGSLLLAVVLVPEGQTAELIHTDEHGVNPLGPGLYAIHGKREQADEIRRVTD